jgi:hypothetical protein
MKLKDIKVGSILNLNYGLDIVEVSKIDKLGFCFEGSTIRGYIGRDKMKEDIKTFSTTFIITER